MLKNVSQLIQNKFIKSSTIVLCGSLLANILNYLFNLVVGRMLTPAEYGEVAALVTLVTLVSVPSSALSNLMAKYIAGYQAQGQTNLVQQLFKFITRYALWVGLIILFLFWSFVPEVSGFLKADVWPLIIFALILPTSLVSGVSGGTLQGLHLFGPLSTKNVLSAVLKLVISVILIALGLSVMGVIWALVLSSVISYLYNLLKLKPILNSQEQGVLSFAKIPKAAYQYLVIIFFSTLFLVTFSNIDVILAKHYLSEFDAGQYAALAVIGRIITYGSTALITVMLPMAAASRSQGDGKDTKLLKISLALIIAVSLLLLGLFVTVPDLIVKILFGAKYLPISHYLGLFGLSASLFVVSQVFVNYFLAVHNTKFIYPFSILAILQIVLITFFHQNILAIIYSMLISSFLLLVSLSIVYIFNYQKQETRNKK